MITQNDITDLVKASSLAGFNVSEGEIILLDPWKAGIDTHIPEKLRSGFAAIYIFKWDDRYLKVGRIGAKSNARYLFQHYNYKSAKSNLASSIYTHSHFQPFLQNVTPDVWLKENTTRFNILIPETFGKYFMQFAEAFFILKCKPLFESGNLVEI